MRIVIDFDYTLFNTEAMRTAFVAALNELGVDRKSYRAAETKAKKSGVYKLEEHLDLLFPDNKTKRFKANKAMHNLLENAELFLYPDALSFLQNHKKAKLTLLTFGAPEWQERKIMDSGVDAFVDEVITTDKSKAEIILQWTKEDLVFINDRGSEIDVMHKILPDATYVWVRRLGAPYRDEKCEFSTLEETDLSFDLNSLIP